MAASSSSVRFEVVHEQVVVRSAPSTSARMLCLQCRGRTVQGEPFEIEGEPWLHLDSMSRQKLFLEAESGWMLIDGRSIGLGRLLRQSLPSSAASRVRAKPQLSQRLSRPQRVALQEACLATYRTEEFQHDLHKAWAEFQNRASEQAEARVALCRKVQVPLLKKYPAAASSPHLLSVFEGHACFRQEDEPNRREAELSAWVMWLLSPCAQVVHPRGPPPDVGPSTAVALSEMFGPAVGSTPPRRRVLDRVPVAAGAAASRGVAESKRKVCVQVLAGLSGNVLCTFSADIFQRVCDLKKKISSSAGIDPDEQKLVCGSQVVKDHETIHRILSSLGDDPRPLDMHHKDAGMTLDVKLMRVEPERVSLLRKLEKGTVNLWDLDPPDSEDPDYALAAIRRNGLMLKFIPEALQNSLDFISEAVRLQGAALEYASKELQSMPEVARLAVQEDGCALRHASSSVRNDRSVVLDAVEKHGTALRFASDALQADLEVALAAVERDGMALQHVHPDVASRRDVTILALQQDKRAAKFVAPELRHDDSFLSTLEDLGLFEDTMLEPLLRIENRQAHSLLQQKAALFIDARTRAAFDVSRVPGALSLPIREGISDVSDTPAFQVILDNPSLRVIVYSDTGGDASRCAYIARQLRKRSDVRTHRVLRLIGGLNLWKYDGLESEGDPRQMFAGQFLHRVDDQERWPMVNKLVS